MDQGTRGPLTHVAAGVTSGANAILVREAIVHHGAEYHVLSLHALTVRCDVGIHARMPGDVFESSLKSDSHEVARRTLAHGLDVRTPCGKLYQLLGLSPKAPLVQYDALRSLRESESFTESTTRKSKCSMSQRFTFYMREIELRSFYDETS